MTEEWRITIKRTPGSDTEIENDGELDEVVIGRWFHLEKMSPSTWWMRIGNHGVSVDVSGERPVVDVDLDRY